jgi:hypothetical protein
MNKVKMALILFFLSAALSLNGCGVTNVIKKGKNAALAIKEDYGTFANCDEVTAALSKKIVKAVNDGSAEKIKKLYAKGKYDGSVNDLIKNSRGKRSQSIMILLSLMPLFREGNWIIKTER